MWVGARRPAAAEAGIMTHLIPTNFGHRLFTLFRVASINTQSQSLQLWAGTARSAAAEAVTLM